MQQKRWMISAPLKLFMTLPEGVKETEALIREREAAYLLHTKTHDIISRVKAGLGEKEK